MRKAFAVAAACTVLALIPTPALAWGTAAHRYIMRRAIDLLPPEIRPFFIANADEIVVRVTDPDLWRTVGWDDDPNHFVDFGAPELRRVSVHRAAARGTAPRSRSSAPPR